MTTGTVLDIQRFCLDDGPGIRTTVFLKGCPLRCLWCHNPESFTQEPQLGFLDERCVHCGACAEVCPQGLHTAGGRHEFKREKCTTCGICAEACPSGALRMFGREMTVEEVMKEIKKDERYYESSGGGVTFSGGEPVLQFEFLLNLLKECKKEKVYHSLLETSGYMPREKLETLCSYVDLFYFDYKATDCETHRKLTGVSNELILDNLIWLCEKNIPVVLRCPVIPGVNDDEGHFAAIRGLLKKYAGILDVEIMAYHNTGRQKWNELGKNYVYADMPSATDEQRLLWQTMVTLRS